MVVQIEFDESGQIRSIAGVTSIKMPDATEARLARVPRQGHTIVELETEDIKHERDFEGLQKVMKNYRITGHPKEPRLVHK
jgi:hypothetical protein